MITAIVTCTCKKNFIVRIPEKAEDIIGLPKTTFLVARCPICKMLTRFQVEENGTIEEGLYSGRMEIHEKMPKMSPN